MTVAILRQSLIAAQGDTGVGDTGVPGDTGVGDTGLPGDTGIGDTGLPGDTGIGDTGLPGDTGVGDTGVGDTGISGDTGAAGDTGVGPGATQIGQVLFSIDGATMTAELPLTDIAGWLVEEINGILLVVD